MQLLIIFVGVCFVSIISDASTAFITDKKSKMNKSNENRTLGTRELQGTCDSRENNISSKIMKLDCGGAIDLPMDGKPIFVDYKSNERYDSYEKCVWLLDTAVGGKRKVVNLKITLKSEGLVDDGDQLVLLDWNAWTVQPRNIRGPKYTHKFTGHWFYLSFATNGALNGKGFLLQLEVTLTPDNHPGSNFVFTNTTGVYSYNPKTARDQIAVIINPRTRTPNKIQSTHLVAKINTKPRDTCKGYDVVYMFTVGLGQNSAKQVLCGKGITYDLTTSHPIIVAFSAQSFGTSFKLEWSQITS